MKKTKYIIIDIAIAIAGLIYILLMPACAPKPVTREQLPITYDMLVRDLVITSNDSNIKIHPEYLTDLRWLQIVDSIHQAKVDSMQLTIDSLIRLQPRDNDATP